MTERDYERERLEGVCDLLRMTGRPMVAYAIRLQYEALDRYSGKDECRRLLDEAEQL